MQIGANERKFRVELKKKANEKSSCSLLIVLSKCATQQKINITKFINCMYMPAYNIYKYYV